MSAYIHNTRGFLQMPTKMIVTLRRINQSYIDYRICSHCHISLLQQIVDKIIDSFHCYNIVLRQRSRFQVTNLSKQAARIP